MDATASSVAASTGRGRAACGCGARGAAAAAGVAAITPDPWRAATASRRYGLDLVSGSVQESEGVLGRSFAQITIYMIFVTPGITTDSRCPLSGATKGLAYQGTHDRA